MFNFVTVDGYFAGLDGNIDWHPVHEEFSKFSVEFLAQCDIALFGRVTYDLFAGYWPMAESDVSLSAEDRLIAKALNEMQKVVVTHNALNSDWSNTEVWQGLNSDIVNELKRQAGKNIVIYGSGTIVKQLTDMGLIDEYRIIVVPVILGGGKSLFAGNEQMQLKLIDTKTFSSGSVLLGYGRDI